MEKFTMDALKTGWTIKTRDNHEYIVMRDYFFVGENGLGTVTDAAVDYKHNKVLLLNHYDSETFRTKHAIKNSTRDDDIVEIKIPVGYITNNGDCVIEKGYNFVTKIDSDSSTFKTINFQKETCIY